MPLPLKHFYMIRHGETEANRAKIMAGSMETPLTKLGRQQAEDAHYVLKSLERKPGRIIHSHLSRARDTAHILNEVLQVPLHEDEGLAEIHVGVYEGASYEDCMPIFEGQQDPQDGETHAGFHERIRRSVSQALEKHDDTVLFVCHGGVLAGLARLYGVKPAGLFQNCHLYEFEPNTSHKTFPWHVWQYDQEETITRKKAKIFYSDEEDSGKEDSVK